MKKNGKIAIRSKIISAIGGFFILLGIILLVFPTISNFIMQELANEKIREFDELVSNVRDGSYDEAFQNGEVDEQGHLTSGSKEAVLYQIDLDKLWEDSVEYNNNLIENQGSLLVDSNSYTSPALDLSKYGIFNNMYGYVSAPSINMNLPIYLGSNKSTMSYGAAHLTYTSLPIGGESTNTVLAGHTGYIGRIFFDNIRNLQIGDEICLTNYWETLTYEVVKTAVYEPSETADIYISEGDDLLTLLTCANGGKQRFYVICKRK